MVREPPGGPPQALGAVLGALLVAGFFLFGTLGTSAVAAYVPQAALVVALLTYTLQVLLLAAVLVAVSRSAQAREALDVRWLAGTVIVGTFGWMTALLVKSTQEVRG